MTIARPHATLVARMGCVALVLVLSACGSVPLTQRGIPALEEGAGTRPPSYSLVFFIHGDGDYRFHDADGTAHRADEEALAGAKRVAERNPRAEVFIFHAKPRRHALFFIPRPDGEFYYYRQGRLLVHESYRRGRGRSRFNPEISRYHEFSAEGASQPKRFFLYFGHEIPEYDGVGYDRSYPRQAFTMPDLADGLKKMTRDSTRFDLVVLSTCFSGTPHTVSTLAPYARTIVASPENLHLSYFDLHPFEWLDVGLLDGGTGAFAEDFARQTFDRLSADIQTAVTVAVYDVDRVQGYVHSVAGAYDKALTTLKGASQGFAEHFDCAEDPAYALPERSEGVIVFYRPPSFGRSKHKLSHSGWECWKLPE